MNNGLRICVGSGQRPHGFGWINLDCQEKWRTDTEKAGGSFVLGNMTAMPFPDTSASLVVGNQVYEHLDFCREGPAFLREAHRVLSPGGSLILTVPDAEALARRWIRYRDRVNQQRPWNAQARMEMREAGDSEIDDFIFAVNIHGAYNGDESDRHRWLWTHDTLKRSLMENCRWREVRPFNWRQIPGADIVNAWWVASAEAVK